jgi:hypothetical protein
MGNVSHFSALCISFVYVPNYYAAASSSLDSACARLGKDGEGGEGWRVQLDGHAGGLQS